MINKAKELAKDFVPPVAVEAAKHIMDTFSSNMRYTPFKYLPQNVDPKWIMDIGANEGNVARAALKTFPKANIVCFEPSTDTFKQLVKNMDEFRKKDGSPQQVFLEHMALANYNGEAKLNLTNFHPANSLMTQSKYYSHYNPSVKEIGTETVKVARLDDICSKLPSKHFEIVKIDVEGLEKEVLDGGALFFQNCVDYLIVEISFQRQDQRDGDYPHYLEILNMLDRRQFKLINIYDVENLTYNYPNKIMNDMMVVQMDCIFKNIRRK